ncbi:hypothetical protein MVEN_00074500 [Mycena venus]|uniref:Uncharacterized protein n=1 Tax=Mycena venus TaxID=2733690 RepID=A0A8H6Z7R7_9AGAR|nr:hypothetical protein MVEN_00074500 [Mycena venus]
MSAAAIAAASGSHGLPRRLLKPKAPDDEDDVPCTSVRAARCFRRRTSPNLSLKSHRMERYEGQPGVDESAPQRPQPSPELSGILELERQYQQPERSAKYLVGKMRAALIVMVSHALALAVSAMHKGKARESVKSMRLQTETAWSPLAERCDCAAGIPFVIDVDNEIPPALHRGAFVYLKDKDYSSPTPPLKMIPIGQCISHEWCAIQREAQRRSPSRHTSRSATASTSAVCTRISGMPMTPMASSTSHMSSARP